MCFKVTFEIIFLECPLCFDMLDYTLHERCPCLTRFMNLKYSKALIFKLLLLEVSTRQQHFLRPIWGFPGIESRKESCVSWVVDESGMCQGLGSP